MSTQVPGGVVVVLVVVLVVVVGTTSLHLTLQPSIAVLKSVTNSSVTELVWDSYTVCAPGPSEPEILNKSLLAPVSCACNWQWNESLNPTRFYISLLDLHNAFESYLPNSHAETTTKMQLQINEICWTLNRDRRERYLFYELVPKGQLKTCILLVWMRVYNPNEHSKTSTNI